MTTHSNDNGRPLGSRGVEIMTAFLADPNCADFKYERIEEIYRDEGEAGLLFTAVDLSEVSAWLLVRLAQASGRTELEIVQQMGREFAAR